MVDVGLKLWLEGKTASQVVYELNQRFICHATRSAWLGKLNRLAAQGVMVRRLDSKSKPPAKPVPTGAKVKKLRLPAVKLAASAAPGNVLKWKQPEKPISKAGLVTIDKATGCLYAITSTSKGIHLFCNKAKALNSNYCQEHHDLCHHKAAFPIKKILRFAR